MHFFVQNKDNMAHMSLIPTSLFVMIVIIRDSPLT